MTPRDQVLEVWGDFACFTRPETKVERFSYPLMTPSAARGILDAVYCKPVEFRWQVTRIEVLLSKTPGAPPPPSYIALRRNEVKEKVSVSQVTRWRNGGGTIVPIYADGDRALLGTDQKGRTQRQTLALRDVRYRIHAQVRPWPGFEAKLSGIENCFRRRAAGGKCVYQPCFGCREFPAFFELVEPGAALDPPAALDLDVGLMLYDVFDLSRPGTPTDPPRISLFRAEVRGGVLEVPPWESPEVLKGAGRL